MANTANIQILRSYANSSPTTLLDGQLAFSFKSNTLYIGSNTGSVIAISDQATANLAKQLANTKVSKSGDTMTGSLILSGEGTDLKFSSGSSLVGNEANNLISIKANANNDITGVSAYEYDGGVVQLYSNNRVEIITDTGAAGALWTFGPDSSLTFPDGSKQYVAYDATYAQGAFAKANSASANTVITQGVDATQNTNIIAAASLAQAAYNTANAAGSNQTVIAAFNQANTAYNVATSASSNTTYLQGGLNTANSNISLLFGISTTQNTNIQNAYNQANTATGLAQAAFNLANTESSQAFTQSVANTANSAQANTIYTQGVDASQNVSIALLQAGLITANANTVYTQAGLNTANGNISALQGGLITANANSFYIQSGLNSANANISILFGIETTQNTNITNTDGKMQSAYNQANVTAGGLITANANSFYIQSGLNTANGNISALQGGLITANANSFYIQAGLNTANSKISVIQGVDDTQNTNIAATDGKMQSAYNKANSSLQLSGSTQTVSSNVIIQGNLTVTGNVSYTGNVTSIQITGNTGQFFGYAANGFNALYAGIPTGYLVEPQMILQLTSNFNGYAGGINMQNENSGQNASSDLFITADNGSVNDGFLDLGLSSSTYNYPGYSLIGKNDGYLFVTGNTTTGGGNMIVGTGLNNDVIFATGGIETTNEVMRITSGNNVVIRSTNPSTSIFSGALQVQGGVGVTGNIYANSATVNGINVYNYMTAAYAQANTTAGGLITANANTVYIKAGLDSANANIAILFGIESTQNTWISSNVAYMQGVNNTQNTNIQLAWNRANNSLQLTGYTSQTVNGNVTFNDVVISGNVKLNGISNDGSQNNILYFDSNSGNISYGTPNKLTNNNYTLFLDSNGGLNLPGNDTGYGIIRRNGSRTHNEINIVSNNYVQMQWTDNSASYNPNDVLISRPTNWIYVDPFGTNIECVDQYSNYISWSFDFNGNLNFPDQTSQTTAFTGVAVDANARANIIYIQGVNDTQNTNIQLAWNTANNALSNIGPVVTVNSSARLFVSNTQSSTSNTTGALVVAGGLGVSGNTYHSSNIYITGANTGVVFPDGTFQSSAGNQVVFNTDTFTVTTSPTFVLSRQPTSANSVFVNINGILQAHASYILSGSTITLSEVPYSGSVVEISYNYNTNTGVFVQTNNFLPIAFGPSGALTDVASVALASALIAA
jgi:hypothetical protein